MAEQVLKACEPLGATVVCDDPDVATWARERRAAVAWTPGLDLNRSVAAAIRKVANAGIGRAIVAHADLPFASDLARFAQAEDDEVVICPDRHGLGTNVMSLPTDAGMTLSYGRDSLSAHCSTAGKLGLRARIVEDAALGWDIDDPEDLDPPAELGTMPVPPLVTPLEPTASDPL